MDKQYGRQPDEKMFEKMGDGKNDNVLFKMLVDKVIEAIVAGAEKMSEKSELNIRN